ncbi:hypothetical protein [Paenibacillus sonchi]|uniref:hypothetical protein n=1 Tax=Paenibacillus sonchi TaxID=373687 RepID=UPI001E463254|nr:hypothetical protein [Paenibacillus sonchi]
MRLQFIEYRSSPLKIHKKKTVACSAAAELPFFLSWLRLALRLALSLALSLLAASSGWPDFDKFRRIQGH